MEIDLADVSSAFRVTHQTRASRHAVSDRLSPRIFQYDHLGLNSLVRDIERLIAAVPLGGRPHESRPLALDLGCGKSPYREIIEARGFALKTMDIDAGSAPDFIGTLEENVLPDDFADLVLCTQVLEHSNDPGRGAKNIFRILRPGGHAIVTAPHIWFYHPHPSDNWRFTQEGLTRLIADAGFEPLRLLAQGGSVLSYFQIVNFLLYGIVGRLGAPLFAINNVVGALADRLFRNELFCLNFAVLARKPAG
jgi:SAM-dependent methyltransferase